MLASQVLSLGSNRSGSYSNNKKKAKTAAEQAAKEGRWSGRQFYRAKQIMNEGTEEDKKQIMQGKKSIWAISKDIEDRKKREELSTNTETVLFGCDKFRMIILVVRGFMEYPMVVGSV
jgi:G3E family GTPase